MIDGDTVRVRYPSGLIDDVRLIGIDAAERTEPYAREARVALVELVGGRDVALQIGIDQHDRYRRRLAYVWVDGVDAGAELVRRGLACVVVIEPNTEHLQRYTAIEVEAQAARVGMWEGLAPPFAG